MLKIGIIGCTGRMGRFIAQEIHQTEGLELVGGSVRARSPYVGQSLSQIVPGYDAVKITDNPSEMFQKSQIVIDFSTAGSTMSHLSIAEKYKVPMVIGTTNLSPEDEVSIIQTSQHIPIFQAFNMSLGNTLMVTLVEKMAKSLDESFDIEIFEMHHSRKKDAPSGSSLNLGRSAARGRGITFPESINLNRNRARQKGEIGFSVSRGGNVTGDHSVTFAGDKEMLTISHRAFSPDIFAQGAVKAAIWLMNQKPGRYEMNDLLGL